jgi:LPS sulfotransferase NodH
MAGLNKFIILSHGRTGSTVLVRTLAQHPRIQAYEELFHGSMDWRLTANGQKYTEGEDAGAFCRDVVFRDPNDSGKPTVGFKIFFFHARNTAAEYEAWKYLSGDRSIRVIYLLRKNMFDSWVSEQRSRRSGTWYLQPRETPPPAHTDPIFIDPTTCRHYFEQTTAEIEWARLAFRHHESMQTTFEELQADFPAGVNRVVRFLGEQDMQVTTPFERLNTVSHAQGVSNYEELVTYFQHSTFRRFFLPDEIIES